MNESRQFLCFNSRDELTKIDIRHIVYFESCGNYTKYLTTNKLSGLIRLNLMQLEDFLRQNLDRRSSSFVRIGKRFIINTSLIYRIQILKQCVELTDFERFVCQIPISKTALKNLKSILTDSAVSETAYEKKNDSQVGHTSDIENQ